MKAHIAVILPFTWLLFHPSFAQIGIGVDNPTESLSVLDGLNIDHNNLNPGGSLMNGLRFGNTTNSSMMVGISSKRTGGSNSYGLEFYTGNLRRMIIDQFGRVGVGKIPEGYNLDINGNARVTANLYADINVVAEGTVTAGTDVTAANDVTATNGNISAPNGVLMAGSRGVVMSNNATRQKVATYTVTLGVSGLPSGGTGTGLISLPAGSFTSAPTAYVGNVITENGEYYKALIVLENVTTSSITVRVVNPTPNPITFSGAQWKILAIGPY